MEQTHVQGNFTAPPYIKENFRPRVVPALHNQGLTFMQDNAPYIKENFRSQVVPALHNQGPTFIQDNAPSHKARITKFTQFLYKKNDISQFSIHDLPTHLI
ncbi:hypothetical protein ElyMa_000468400 [Elysia marginata]|uniref:Tc1-like transposase DDE domain-containing protein n=1 Tax=Elysia marginata TaxID=1093978 RepID=A0AAV4FT38_9GAST|nr:hypothetical protein ElyMa_000468400 [Elysia marginata]